MDRNEIERELLEVCERVATARQRYEELNRVEDTIRGVNTLNTAMGQTLRTAKHDLADVVRVQALEQDKLWRKLIETCAERILMSFETKLTDLHDAVVVESESGTRQVEAIELLRQLHDRVKSSAINFGDFTDLMDEVGEFLNGPEANPASPPRGWDKV